MEKRIVYTTLITLLFAGIFACTKTTETQRVFGVQTQQISTTNINKEQLKKQIEFISNAYSDIFGKSIPGDELNNSVNCYAGVGDKDLVTDRIIRSYLNRDNLILPSNNQINTDLPGFVVATYNKFYHRPPTEMENWKMQQLITNDLNLTTASIYYSFLTSDEYKFH